MKIRADEHVSPCIVRIVCELAANPECDFSSVYDSGHRGADDTHWITAFADEGGDAILSADKDFFKKPHQVVAIDDRGLRVIHLPPRWANARGRLQASHILMWWPRIENVVKVAKPREFWAVKWNIREEGNLERRKVDYALFRKKLQKANRPARQKVREEGPAP